MSAAQRLLLEGVTDAVGFMGGALAGYGLGQVMGWDIFSEGYSASSMVGILCVGLCSGLGLQLVRRWRAARARRAAGESST